MLFALLLVFLLCACSPPKVEDIGVIGGADGPTDITVTDDAQEAPASDSGTDVSQEPVGEPEDETA